MKHRHSHDEHTLRDRWRRFVRGERDHEGGRHFGGRWRHDGGGGFGLRRFFAHGDLRLVILNLIAEKPCHGYEIIKAIEERVGGAYSPSPGVIYPTLTLLEELGYVTVSAESESTKKLHEVTPQGRAYLEANRPALDGLLSRMAEASRRHGGGRAPQVARAVENLRLALRMRLARGPLSAEQVDELAAVLDAAAAKVEKI